MSNSSRKQCLDQPSTPCVLSIYTQQIGPRCCLCFNLVSVLLWYNALDVLKSIVLSSASLSLGARPNGLSVGASVLYRSGRERGGGGGDHTQYWTEVTFAKDRVVKVLCSVTGKKRFHCEQKLLCPYQWLRTFLSEFCWLHCLSIPNEWFAPEKRLSAGLASTKCLALFIAESLDFAPHCWLVIKLSKSVDWLCFLISPLSPATFNMLLVWIITSPCISLSENVVVVDLTNVTFQMYHSKGLLP